MCWNAPVSLMTYMTSFLICLFLWRRNWQNDRPLVIFINCFALMQLFEFFMWRNMADHSWASKLSYLTVLLQPVSLAGSLLYFRGKLYSSLEKLVLWSICLLFAIKTIGGAYFAFQTEAKRSWLSTVGPHCHLQWWFMRKSNEMPSFIRPVTHYFLALLFGLSLIKPFSSALVYVLFFATSFGITYKYYGNEYGSLWCWIANLAGLLTLVMPKLVQYL